MGRLMETRALGLNGPTVSAIGLGCMGMSEFYGLSDREAALATIAAALEAGVTLFDTGDFYGMGHNEMLLAEALRGKRDKAFIQVKFGSQRSPDGSFLGIWAAESDGGVRGRSVPAWPAASTAPSQEALRRGRRGCDVMLNYVSHWSVHCVVGVCGARGGDVGHVALFILNDDVVRAVHHGGEHAAGYRLLADDHPGDLLQNASGAFLEFLRCDHEFDALLKYERIKACSSGDKAMDCSGTYPCTDVDPPPGPGRASPGTVPEGMTRTRSGP